MNSTNAAPAPVLKDFVEPLDIANLKYPKRVFNRPGDGKPGDDDASEAPVELDDWKTVRWECSAFMVPDVSVHPLLRSFPQVRPGKPTIVLVPLWLKATLMTPRDNEGPLDIKVRNAYNIVNAAESLIRMGDSACNLCQSRYFAGQAAWVGCVQSSSIDAGSCAECRFQGTGGNCSVRKAATEKDYRLAATLEIKDIGSRLKHALQLLEGPPNVSEDVKKLVVQAYLPSVVTSLRAATVSLESIANTLDGTDGTLAPTALLGNSRTISKTASASRITKSSFVKPAETPKPTPTLSNFPSTPRSLKRHSYVQISPSKNPRIRSTPGSPSGGGSGLGSGFRGSHLDFDGYMDTGKGKGKGEGDDDDDSRQGSSSPH